MLRSIIILLTLIGCSSTPQNPPHVEREKFLSAYATHLQQSFPDSCYLYEVEEDGLKGVKIMHKNVCSQKEALTLFQRLVTDFQTFSNNYPHVEYFFPKKKRKRDKLTFELSFWTEALDRPSPEFAAHITLDKGHVIYYRKQLHSEALDEEHPTIFTADEIVESSR